MEKTILGLHHVTCIASDPQANLNFYTRVLGLRLVKLTVNFDDPSTYHFYFGDESGSPGTLITFFPWANSVRGRVGAGQATGIAFSIPEGSGSYWILRLSAMHVEGVGPLPDRFGEKIIGFDDPDGLPIELIESFSDARRGRTKGPVPADSAILGIHGVTLTEQRFGKTLGLLTETMGLRLVGEDRNRFRYAAGEGNAGALIDVRVSTADSAGIQGAGTTHHIAFRTADDDAHAAWRETIAEMGYRVTSIIDRTYFRSIYFREPGGVLFEIATDPPGMTVDESIEALGHALMLPAQYESERSSIERGLPKLDLR